MGAAGRGQRQRLQVARCCHGRCAPAHHFDPDRALDNVQLARNDLHFPRAFVAQHDGGHRLGECLNELMMALRSNDPDRVENHVVGENRAHIREVAAGAPNQRLDVERNALAPAPLEIIGANVGLDNEIAHENAIEIVVGLGRRRRDRDRAIAN